MRAEEFIGNKKGSLIMKKGAVVLTAGAVIVCIVILLCVSVTAPFLADLFADYRELAQKVETVILISYYICAAAAFAALVCLLRILDNIWRDRPFTRENPRLMAIISYCCLVVAAATVFAGFYYMPMWLIAAAMLFICLILRVVRGCFIAAFYLNEENSLTI